MRAGIVGFSKAGKRTLFELLTQVAGTTLGRTEQIGVLKVPDEKLQTLAELHASRETTPATIDFVFIPSLVKGRSSDALELSNLQGVDVIVLVVRAFDEPSVPHPEGSVDASRDIAVMELELTISDLAIVEKRHEKLLTDQKKGKDINVNEMKLLEKAKVELGNGHPLRSVFSFEERQQLKGFALLTAKPMLAVVNVGEQQASEPQLTEKLALGEWESAPEFQLTYVSAKIEAEIAELPLADAENFRNDMGLHDGMVERVVRAAFELLQVVTFYTAGDNESRAWIVPCNTSAAKAAGTIHSDMQRGFIRAEVVNYDVLLSSGSWNNCRDKGLLRLEGKDYPITESDVVYFRFNV